MIFDKHASTNYTEIEYVTLFIRNDKPTIALASSFEITVYDDQVKWINFTLNDYENSNLLRLKFVSAPASSQSWITIDPSTNYRSVLVAPQRV